MHVTVVHSWSGKRSPSKLTYALCLRRSARAVACVESHLRHNLPGIESQFAARNLGFAMQVCNCVAKNCVKHIVHAVAIMQLLSWSVDVATQKMSSKLFPAFYTDILMKSQATPAFCINIIGLHSIVADLQGRYKIVSILSMHSK